MQRWSYAASCIWPRTARRARALKPNANAVLSDPRSFQYSNPWPDGALPCDSLGVFTSGSGFRTLVFASTVYQACRPPCFNRPGFQVTQSSGCRTCGAHGQHSLAQPEQTGRVGSSAPSIPSAERQRLQQQSAGETAASPCSRRGSRLASTEGQQATAWPRRPYHGCDNSDGLRTHTLL